MLLIITLRHDVVVIINVISTAFFDCGYKLRRFKISYKRTSSIFIALKHRFLKGGNNVTSVLYIFNKAIFLIRLIICNITRLSLTCLGRDICFYINVFFLCTYFLLT